MYYPDSCLDGPRKITKNLSQYSRSIFRFYDKRKLTSGEKLVLKLRDKIKYICSVSLMFKTLKIVVFKYSKTNGGSTFLMGRGRIVAARIKFF
jgi:hypothetical protein